MADFLILDVGYYGYINVGIEPVGEFVSGFVGIK